MAEKWVIKASRGIVFPQFRFRCGQNQVDKYRRERKSNSSKTAPKTTGLVIF